MPPKVKITKEDIIETAFRLLRENGERAINARTVALTLKCSTQPVFSNFSNMEELKEKLRARAYKHYLAFLEREMASGRYPVYKSFGMAYIRFAKEEKELFKLLFMCQRKTEDTKTQSPDVEASVELIMSANGVSRETAELMHLEMWSCVHGIATMLVTSFFEPGEELISQMLSDVYKGVRLTYLEGSNGSN